MDLGAPDSRSTRPSEGGPVALRWRHGLLTVPYPPSAVHRPCGRHRNRRARSHGLIIRQQVGLRGPCLHHKRQQGSRGPQTRRALRPQHQAGWCAEENCGSLDLIISTVNAGLDVPGVLDTLAPKGRLHNVGAVLNPLQVPAFSLILGQKSVSGSPTGSPTAIDDMLQFCARHSIAQITETFPMSKVNDAFERLRSGKARYRLVLENEN
jgi:hypothetical protein